MKRSNAWPMLLRFTAIVVAIISAVGTTIYFSFFRRVDILLSPRMAVANAEHNHILTEWYKIIAVVNPEVLSFSDTRAIVVEEAKRTNMDEVVICSGTLWGISHEFPCTVIAFGDTWKKTLSFSRTGGATYIIAPRSPPPDGGDYQDYIVILGLGPSYVEVNKLWMNWCQNHHALLLKVRGMDRESIQRALQEAAVSRLELVKARAGKSP